MRPLWYLILGLCVLCCPGIAPELASSASAPADQAPTREPAAYVQVELTAPVWSTDSLRVSFRADEAQCRREYGENWWNGCFVALGSADAPARGVELRGHAVPAGEWRWEDYSTLVFTPKTSWPVNTAFTVDMRKLTVPLRARLNTRTLQGSTLPLAGQSEKGEVWIDPSASGPRALSFALRFTAPVDRSLEKTITVKERGAAQRANSKNGLTLGSLNVVWGQDNTSCLVKVPVTALPDKDTVLTLQVPGVRPLAIKNGKATLLAGTLQQTATIPGRQQLFRVSEAALDLNTTENLRREYHLSLKTTLRIPAVELLKALQVVELPRLQNPEATEPYAWNAAPAITQADMARARPLKVELVRDPGSSGEPLVLRVPATPGSFVYCQLPAGFGPKGYTLSAPWTAVFSAEQAGSTVNFLQPGHVLTLTPGGDNRLDIVSSGVDEVRWRATRIRTDSLNLLQIMGNAPSRFELYNYIDVAGTVVEGTIPLAGAGQNRLAPRFSTLALSELMRGGTGVLHVELRGLRDGKEMAQTSRMVLATDLGMVSKLLPDGSRQVYVCSLSSGQPVHDAVVRILGANGQSVAEARTDAAGYAPLPAVRGLAREKEPVALVASRAVAATKVQDKAQTTAQGQKTADATEDLAWMALDDSARRVDYSRFPTQGQVSSPDNINAYVFGQRGIFRPGETLRFGVMLRRGDWKALPPDLPLTATLTDSAGRVAMRRNFTVGQGLVELSWASQETSPTGRYRLDVTSPASEDIMGTGAVRVEEFQPDTLAIRAEVVTAGAAAAGDKGEAVQKIPDQKPAAPKIPQGWLVTSGDAAEASLAVYLRNFYGLPAEGRKIRAELSVRPAELRFAGFEDFTFPDMLPLPAAGEAATATVLPEAQTTAAGEALVPLPLAAYQKRTMQCRVLVEGFEADGGRAVTTEKTFLVSPLPVMLGYRLSGAVSSTGYVPQGTKGGLEFVALGPDVRPATAQTLGSVHLSVAERRYVTVLATDAQGKYVYEENPVDKEISGSTAQLDAHGRLQWSMPTDKPGEYLLTVRDSAKRVMARIPYTVAGNDDVRAALEPEASALPPTQMRLRLDKTDYAPGDTVNLFMAAPYAGVGLITLERDRVARHVWFKAPAGNSVHTLTIPQDFEGRGYINVSMGRAVTSSEIFMQPHSFAVAPLTVNAAGRDMGLRVEAPREVLPGTALKARVTARHEGKALIFAVDEGVLQLTRFTTPDPLRYLLLDRALEVATDQLFDLLMPAHSQLSKRLPAFGGDLHMGGGRFNNPFKRRNEPPLAWWSGLVDTGPQGTEVSIPVPAYTNGQVRIMVVAASSGTVGSAEGSTVARAPLVITPQLPLMAAPGDVFEGGIALHNTTDKALVVALRTEMTGLVPEKNLPQKSLPQKNLPEKVDMAAGKEIFLPLRMQAGATPGEASFTVVATPEAGITEAGARAAQEFRRTATLSVRPAVLPRQEQRTGFASGLSGGLTALKGGKLPAEALARDLFTFKADAAASVSTAPLPPVRVLLRALAAYPYDCVEQSTSRALPLVLLQRRTGMTALLTPPVINGKPRAEEHARVMEGAITAIRAAFKPDMGVSSWADAPGADTLLTAYVGDYLLLLREAGLAVPGDLSTSFFATLRERVTDTPESLEDARAHAYGLWVLTRHGFVTAQWLDSLREQLDARWPGWTEDVTATLMAGSYAIMNMRDAAQELVYARGAGAMMQHSEGLLTPLAAQALHVTVLARHFPEFLADKAGQLAAVLVEKVNSFSGSTMEAALGARALLELAVPVKSSAATAVAMPDKNAAPADNPFAGLELRCTAWQPGFEPTAPHTVTAEAAGALPLLSLHAPGCRQFALTATEKAEGQTKSQKADGTTSLYWDVSSDGYDRQPPAKTATNGMEVTRVLKLPDGTVLGPGATVTQGTVLRVELTSRVFGRAESDPASAEQVQVVLADLLPGGFELVLTHPEDALPPNDKGEGYFRLDRREDRVLAYATVEHAPVTFVYHVRAVNRGRYTLPAAYGEGLYDRSCNAHTAAGVIIVE